MQRLEDRRQSLEIIHNAEPVSRINTHSTAVQIKNDLKQMKTTGGERRSERVVETMTFETRACGPQQTRRRSDINYDTGTRARRALARFRLRYLETITHNSSAQRRLDSEMFHLGTMTMFMPGMIEDRVEPN